MGMTNEKGKIKEMKDSMPCPPQPNDFAPDKIQILQSLRVFQEIVKNAKPT